MPMQFIDPEKAGEHNGVNIYHVYKDGQADSRSQYGYTTSYAEDEDFQFDVRDIKVPEDREDLKLHRVTVDVLNYMEEMAAETASHVRVIAHGLDTGQIKVDEDNNG